MKTLRPLVSTALLLLSQFAFAAANDFDQKVQALRIEFDKYFATLPKSPDQRERYGNDAGAYIQAKLGRISSDFKQGNYESADQQLRQLGQQIPTPTTERLVAELLAESQSVRDQFVNAWIDNVGALIDRAGAQILAAKSEKDLDALIEESSILRTTINTRGGQNDRFQRTAQKLESLSYFVRRWQDYLAHLNAGNGNQTKQVLQELANSDRYPIIPRSELLARLSAAQNLPAFPVQAKPPAFVLEAASLEDLPAALDRMRQHYTSIDMPKDDAFIFQNFSSLANATASAETGNLQPAFFVVSQGFLTGPGLGAGFSEHIMKLRVKLTRALMLKVLPRFLDVNAELAPKPDENPAEYCLRVARSSRAAGDWAQVARALEGYERIALSGGQSPAWLSTDRQALIHYLTGLNQEKAGDLENAQKSYLRTLASQGEFVPIDDISARINRLRKVIQDRRDAEQQRQLELMRKQQ